MDRRLSPLYQRLWLGPRLSRKDHLRWWLVWGPVRTGTSLMVDMVGVSARLYVADWGLRNTVQMPAAFGYVGYDRDRARRDISRNILSNADPGQGTAIDLAFKQSGLQVDEYERLVEMWGAPERTIFCYREPEGFMASATRKFPESSIAGLQRSSYVDCLERHRVIGGDKFEYRADHTIADYEAFLHPLGLPPGHEFRLNYGDSRAPELVTEEMRAAYRAIAE